MRQDEFSSVLVTFPDKASAHDIIKHLLEAHMIACANLLPVGIGLLVGRPHGA